MKIDLELVSKIIIPFLTLILGKYLEKWFSKRPNLVSYVGHVSAFTLSNGTPVYTHSIVVANHGKLACNNVRLGHNILPDFQINPPIRHSVEEVKGGKEILIPILVPSEQVTISYLYFPPLTWNHVNSYTKSDEGLAKIINVLPTLQMPRWMKRVVWSLVAVGAGTIVYLLVSLIIWWLNR